MKTIGARQSHAACLSPLKDWPSPASGRGPQQPASERRRRDVDHVRAGAVLGGGLGPADIAAEVVGGGSGLGQRDGNLLLILGSATRQLPYGHVGLGFVVGVNA